MEVHDAGHIGSAGKQLAPLLALVANAARLRNPVRLAGTYLDIIQGKGSGTGWDMSGEISAALRFLANATDPVIFDVGANHGEWTRGVWRALGKGRYYAYEPQAACWQSLQQISVPNISIVRSAMSDHVGEMELHSDRDGSGLASFYERGETYLAHPTQVEIVPVTTMDQAIENFGLDHVDFMKVDVEGAELLVLRGAQRALKDRFIRSFSFEFGSANIYSRVFFRDFWDLLSAHGYALWRIVPGGRLAPVPAYREDLEHFRGVSNYVASVARPR